ncbi:hypothetical protein [Nitrosomonas sp.]|uniref:helix-turn-helix domain-containing protein n=1 Tax=Nitrosomonas sp. TaxID=42353 RepID=UPI0025F841A0|nr:hypothetical protein [Nitrosomonas sp.]
MLVMTTTKKPIRNKRLKTILNERFGGKQSAMAEALGIAANLVSRYVTGGKGIGENMKSDIESRLGLPKDWLDGFDESEDQTKTYKTNDPKKQAMIEMILAIENDSDTDYASYTLRLVTEKHKSGGR